MAGGSLTTLSKLKPGCAPDKRPIAVGEVLRGWQGNACVLSLNIGLSILLSPYSLVWLALLVQKRLFMDKGLCG